MQAALAHTTGGPTPGRRRKTGRPWIIAASAGAHLLVLGGLVAGVQVMPQLVEPPAISVELLHPSLPQETIVRPVETKPAATPRTPAPSAIQPAKPVIAPPTVITRPAAPTGVVAPPGFKARQLTQGGDALREAARDGIGCRNADTLALTKAERAVCDETLGEKNKNRPAMYAVIDPDKKAAFDKVCKKDDDWCLYRSGKGPYPGLLALGKKKKRPGWDD